MGFGKLGSKRIACRLLAKGMVVTGGNLEGDVCGGMVFFSNGRFFNEGFLIFMRKLQRESRRIIQQRENNLERSLGKIETEIQMTA